MSKFIKTFTSIPKEMFRLNNGVLVAHHNHALKCSRIFDIMTDAGKVIPKALDPENYECKNLDFHKEGQPNGK